MALSKKDVKIQEKRAAADPVGYKTFSFSVKEPTIEGRTVCGYLAAFNNIDSDRDLLVKGCFAKSLNERGVDSTNGNKIAHLWQHDMKEPLGSYTVLREDDFGLYFECVYDDIDQANRALTQFKSKTLANFSIGYSYVWEKMEYDEEKDCFVCKELVLYEGSVVTLAANPMAHFVGMKSEQRECELNILNEEAEHLLAGIRNPRKRYELSQLFSKSIALARVKPVVDPKQSLKDEAGKKAQEAKDAAQAAKPKRKFAKLGALIEEK